MTARRAQVGLSLALLLLSIPLLVSEAPAGEKECLTQGLSAERDKNYAQAITRYQQCLSLFSQQIKTSISIYQKLLRVYQVQGQTEEIQRVVSYLKATYPTPECDLKDLERLAHMYLEYGAEADGRQLLARIVSEHATSQRPEEIKVALRAASKLLASYEKHGEREAQAQLIGHLQRHYPTRAFETKDTYDLAVIYLKYEDVEAGKALLQWIAERPGDDAFAKKALFLLGRKAMAARDCEAAIRHYRAYIERYPQNLFYVQKAYQRIVSCHWAAGRKELAEEELKQIADIVNGIADYRSQMNFARDLHWKGKHALAQATFASALALANQVIETQPGSYEAMKAYYEMERHGHAVGRYDVVEQAAAAIASEFETLRGQARDPGLKSAIEQITSQSYLWLGKTRQDQGRHAEAAVIYEEFRFRYPKHKDHDYATYELSRAHEGLGHMDQAVQLYQSVGDGGDGVWKKEAAKRLKSVSDGSSTGVRPR